MNTEPHLLQVGVCQAGQVKGGIPHSLGHIAPQKVLLGSPMLGDPREGKSRKQMIHAGFYVGRCWMQALERENSPQKNSGTSWDLNPRRPEY